MCAEKFPLVLMGGWAEGPVCTDLGARTPISATGNYSMNHSMPFVQLGLCRLFFSNARWGNKISSLFLMKTMEDKWKNFDLNYESEFIQERIKKWKGIFIFVRDPPFIIWYEYLHAKLSYAGCTLKLYLTSRNLHKLRRKLRFLVNKN